MTARYFVADDGDNEPTLWRGNHDDAFPEAILRRGDLPPAARFLWAQIVAAAEGTTPDALRAEGWHAAQKASVVTPFPLRPEDCPWEAS